MNDQEYINIDETEFTENTGVIYENVPNTTEVANEGYVNDLSIEIEYVNRNKDVPIVKSIAKVSSVNPPYDRQPHRKTTQPSWIRRHKTAFAVILSVALSVIISSAIFAAVNMTSKSDEDNGECTYTLSQKKRNFF